MINALIKKEMPSALAIPVGNLDAFVYAASQFPMLSAAEEYGYAKKLREENDLESAKHLIMSHLRFVVRIARGYLGYGLPMADLVQEGNIGLMKAVKRFDPEQGVRLVSFAVHWVRAEMHEYILRNWRIVKVATTKAQRKLFFNLRSSKKRLGWLNAEEVEAVAKDLGVPAKTVLEMESRLSAHDMAFDGSSESDSDDGVEFHSTPAGFLQNPQDDPAYLLTQEDYQAHREQQLGLALEGLDARSKDILARRWLTDDKATLQELANEYQVSAERIRQLENNAMKKLRVQLEA